MKKISKVLSIIAACFFLAPKANAYVDPTFTGMFYQLFYFLIFGVVVGWVFRPFRYLKSLFTRKKEKREGNENDRDTRKSDKR